MARLLTFAAGGQELALRVTCLRKVIHLPSTTSLPNGPKFLQGFLNFAGEHVPIVRLATLLKLPESSDSLYTPVVLLKEIPLALLLFELKVLLTVNLESLSPIPPDHVLNNVLEGSFLHQDRKVHLLDPGRLLLEEEKLRLTHLRLDYEDRLARLDATA